MAFQKSLTQWFIKKKAHHNMTPDERESLTTGQRSLNAKNEKPFHVSEHQPQVINTSWPQFGIQYAKIVDIIAPASPNFNFIVNSQESET